MQIKVTQKHIKRAQKIYSNSNSLISQNCPIALAVKDKIHRFVSVDCTHITYATSSGDIKKLKMPLKARDFVDQFDRFLMDNDSQYPKPLSFSI